MTEVVLRQSRKRGIGIVVAIVTLVVVRFASWGPRIGQFQDEIERQQVEQARTAKVLQGKDIANLRKAFEGEDNAAKKLLETLRKRTAGDNAAAPAAEAPKTAEDTDE